MAKIWKNSTLGERLEYVLEEMEWDGAQLAREIGAPHQSTVGNWLSGYNKTMAPRFAFALQDKYRWNARWLLLSEGPPRISTPDESKEKILDELRNLPLDRLKAVRAVLS